MKNILIVAMLFVIAPANAATPSTHKEISVKSADGAADSSIADNFVISFKLKNAAHEVSGSFLASDGNQSNYVAGGQISRAGRDSKGPQAESKKYGVIVNCIPKAALYNQHVRMECQFEISGPVHKNPELDAWDIDTFQYQGIFLAEFGKPLVLVDDSEHHAEITVTRAP
ncbi:MAG: hypothetical protein ACHQ49_00255 [Elusimicrobiota bacterium]